MSWVLSNEEGRQVWQFQKGAEETKQTSTSDLKTPGGVSYYGLPFMTSGLVHTHMVCMKSAALVIVLLNYCLVRTFLSQAQLISNCHYTHSHIITVNLFLSPRESICSLKVALRSP